MPTIPSMHDGLSHSRTHVDSSGNAGCDPSVAARHPRAYRFGRNLLPTLPEAFTTHPSPLTIVEALRDIHWRSNAARVTMLDVCVLQRTVTAKDDRVALLSAWLPVDLFLHPPRLHSTNLPSSLPLSNSCPFHSPPPFIDVLATPPGPPHATRMYGVWIAIFTPMLLVNASKPSFASTPNHLFDELTPIFTIEIVDSLQGLYGFQVDVESIYGDSFEVGSQLSNNPRSRGRGPTLVDHSYDIKTGAVSICTKKLGDCQVRICATAIDFRSCDSTINRRLTGGLIGYGAQISLRLHEEES
ncbi:hypothetical protein B0H13DRAFT_1918846 [Mycena leptocephala]|nr:hypothetical protein B0H13DRAFT_1918846 [Mycena leptocephala]